MDERFERHVGLTVDRTDLCHGKFAGEDNAFDPQFRRDFDALGTGERHLSRRVHRQVRAGDSNQTCEPDVLHENRVDSRFGELSNERLNGRQFRRKNQRIEGDVALHASLMHERHQFRKFVRLKIRRSRPCVEATVEPEINRVRSVLNGSTNALPVAGRGKQFGAQQRLSSFQRSGVGFQRSGCLV